MGSSINSLSQTDIAAADSLPFASAANGADRRTSVTQLVELIQSLLTVDDGFATQYAAPNATGFGVAIAPPSDGACVYLLLTPAAGYAAGTITLPAQAACVDGQELLVSCTQAVTTLTVAGNGSTVNGAPATLAANAFFRLRFDGVFKAWYRVG
jgi:hypothetical protein